jgi:hypothetical protein
VRTLEVSLIEWPSGPEHGGPRLLGRSADPDLITAVREHLAAASRRELTRLEPPVRLAGRDANDDEPPAG